MNVPAFITGVYPVPISSLINYENKKKLPLDNRIFEASEAVFTSEFFQATPEQLEEMKLQKSGHIWECTDVRWVEGFIYGFRKKMEFSKSQEKCDAALKELSPAFEPITMSYQSPPYFSCGPSPFNSWRDEEHLLRLFGYFFEFGEEGEIILWLPDVKTLQSRIDELGYNFKIRSSEGIAGDKEFVDALLEYDSLLSSGREFVHDHISHIVPTLMTFLGSVHWTDVKYNYKAMSARMREIAGKARADIEKLESTDEIKENEIVLAWGALSSWFDFITNSWGGFWPQQSLRGYYNSDGLIIELTLTQMVGYFIRLVLKRFGPEAKSKYIQAVNAVPFSSFKVRAVVFADCSDKDAKSIKEEYNISHTSCFSSFQQG